MTTTADVRQSTSTGNPGSPSASRKVPLVSVATVLQAWGPAIMLAALFILFSIISPQFLRVPNLLAIMESASIALVLACAMTFIIMMGSIDLSIEGTMATASISLSLLVANSFNENNFGILGLAAVLLLATAAGAANGFLVARFRIQSLIVTLGTWFIGLGTASLLYPARQPVINEKLMVFLGLNRSLGVSPLVVISIIVLLFCVVLERKTLFGRMVRGIGADERLLQLAGISVRAYKIGAFAIAGLLTGIAAVMVTAQLGVGSAQAGQGYLFSTITAVVIGGTLLSGGRGGILQSVIGVLILEVLRNGMILTGIDPYSQRIIEGVGIVTAVVIGNWHMRRRLRVIK